MTRGLPWQTGALRPVSQWPRLSPAGREHRMRLTVTTALGAALALGPSLPVSAASAATRTTGRQSFRGQVIAPAETGARKRRPYSSESPVRRGSRNVAGTVVRRGAAV